MRVVLDADDSRQRLLMSPRSSRRRMSLGLGRMAALRKLTRSFLPAPHRTYRQNSLHMPLATLWYTMRKQGVPCVHGTRP